MMFKDRPKRVKEYSIIILLIIYIMNYSSLLNQLSYEEKCSYRNYEKITKKIVDTKWSLVFNETCLKENIWSTFTSYY